MCRKRTAKERCAREGGSRRWSKTGSPVARPRRRPSRSSLALRWLAVLVLAGIAAAYVQPLRAYRDAQADVAHRQSEVQALQREQGVLSNRLAVARTDEFVERQAHKLGLVRPGERLYIVSGPR